MRKHAPWILQTFASFFILTTTVTVNALVQRISCPKWFPTIKVAVDALIFLPAYLLLISSVRSWRRMNDNRDGTLNTGGDRS